LAHVDVSSSVLASKRAAYVAATTDHEVRDDTAYGSCHSEPLSFEAFEAFAHSVWRIEERQEPLQVTRVEDLSPSVQERFFEDAGAAARWVTPPEPRPPAFVGTSGPVAFLDVKDEALVRLIALHEIAHLLVDTEDAALGHERAWAEAYSQLIERHLSPELGALWRVHFQWWWQKANEHIARDPNWLA
jgi:hypothetical protein